MKWIGLETAKRLHKEEEGVIFIDVRDRRDYVAGHIAEAYCTPLPEIIVTCFHYKSNDHRFDEDPLSSIGGSWWDGNVNWGFWLGECFHVSRWSTYSQTADAWKARATRWWPQSWVMTVSHQLGAQGSTVRSPSSSTVKWLRPSRAAGPFADGYYVQGIKPSKWSGWEDCVSWLR